MNNADLRGLEEEPVKREVFALVALHAIVVSGKWESAEAAAIIAARLADELLKELGRSR